MAKTEAGVMEGDEAFRVDCEIRYHFQGRTVRRTIGGNATSFWMAVKSFGWGGWVDRRRSFRERQAGGR